MKKTAFFTAIFFFLSITFVYAVNVDNQFTEDMPNGRFVLANKDTLRALLYIGGVVDGLTSMHPDFRRQVYPNMTNDDIRDAVQQYYLNNPSQRYRPIAEVLLNGCKEPSEN